MKNVSPFSSKLCRVGSNCRSVRAQRRVASASALATVWGLSEDRQTTRICRMVSSRKRALSMSSPRRRSGLSVLAGLLSGRFRTKIGGGFGKFGEVLVRLAFFLQGLVEDFRHVLVSEGFGPAFQCAVPRNFVVFHGLRSGNQTGVQRWAVGKFFDDFLP